jgi:hypothetical protein
LLRFAHKTPKNRLSADFLPYKLRSDQRSAQPNNRGFFAASSAKNPQVQQAASALIKLKIPITNHGGKRKNNHEPHELLL